MRAIGCFFVIVVIAVLAYLSRGLWWGRVTGRGPVDRAAVTTMRWQPLTPEGAARARSALQRLGARNGPQYVEIAPGDLAAHILQEVSRTLPPSADSIVAAAIGDRLHVQALIRTSDLGASDALGPIAMLLGEQERVRMGGTLRIIRPGFGEFQVKEFRIRDFALPQGVIPRLLRELRVGDRPPGLSPDALPVRTPDYVGDVRISDNKVTVYKVPATKPAAATPARPARPAPNAAKSPDR
jgi:hypothetical protein